MRVRPELSSIADESTDSSFIPSFWSKLWYCPAIRIWRRREEHKTVYSGLKGPKHEIFESGFFTKIRPVRVDDLRTGEKKWRFASWSLYLKVFATNTLLSVCSACAKWPKKFRVSPQKKVVWDALGTVIKGSRKIFKNCCVLNFLWRFKWKRIIKRMLCLLNVHWAYA
jgi:hypothetical protein